eukprot:9616556-Alexandrium_andersonii.AAC.1
MGLLEIASEPLPKSNGHPVANILAPENPSTSASPTSRPTRTSLSLRLGATVWAAQVFERARG